MVVFFTLGMSMSYTVNPQFLTVQSSFQSHVALFMGLIPRVHWKLSFVRFPKSCREPPVVVTESHTSPVVSEVYPFPEVGSGSSSSDRCISFRTLSICFRMYFQLLPLMCRSFIRSNLLGTT